MFIGYSITENVDLINHSIPHTEAQRTQRKNKGVYDEILFSSLIKLRVLRG
jgi:hypothetical protein